MFWVCRLLKEFKARWGTPEIFLEPGEAVALNTGYLVSSVLDVVHNETDIAILDTSAEAHMPDVLEMPYRPNIIGAGLPDEKKYTYRLAARVEAGENCIKEMSMAKNFATSVSDRIAYDADSLELEVYPSKALAMNVFLIHVTHAMLLLSGD